ncbi:hypothetical protein C8Q77DRAFT_1220728 [Trametes polyzona]|nr:hypothetical protein C8Q77DRAFT_1220728 [Trametes polyzona]
MFDPSSDSEEHDLYQLQLGPNPSLALTQHPLIETLRTTLNQTLPYCCGAMTLSPDSFILYYGKTREARRLDLLHASPEALDHLQRSCDPATFGVGQESVLDPAYRKAGKLDRKNFAINIDVERSGVLEAVRTGLFLGKEQGRHVRAELYKLNVYGQGSFFKAHKDTPRSGAMFASLVLVFPTAHTGGTLVVTQGGGRWTFDAASILADGSLPGPRVAYIAFYGDTEHEVTEVTSGHRVTITYNLYYVEDTELNRMENVHVMQPVGSNHHEVKSTLSSLLDDPGFLPNGGILGFGLRHLYPLPTTFHADTDNTLNVLKTRLKGVDAALYRACSELLAPPALYTVFESHTPLGKNGHRALVACPRIVKMDGYDTEDEPPVWEKLCRSWGGVLLNFPHEYLPPSAADGCKPIHNWVVHWVTPLSDASRVKTRFAAYGNEPMIGYLYQRICMLLKVGPPGSRALDLL